MNKKVNLIISPLIVLALMMVIFMQYGLFPLGENSLSWCDMRQQVVPLFLSLKDIICGNANMFLNTQSSGGTSLWGVFLYYMANPLSFLSAFIDKADATVFMNILVLIKMMLCASTAALFFSKFFKNLNNLFICSLSVMYAFSGYNLLFYQIIMWLDVACMFPLLLISLKKLTEDNKPLMYILCLSAMLILNFYLSYMIVIFLILLMGLYIYFCFDYENRKRTIASFGISSIISVLITGVVWLPSLAQYLNSARTTNAITNISSGSFWAPVYTTFFILACSIAILACVPFAVNIRYLKDKRFLLVGTTFLLTSIPIFIDPINKMWHTGSYQAFPARYGFITSFMGLIFLAMLISKISKDNDRLADSNYRLACIISSFLILSLCFICVMMLKNNPYNINSYTRTLWVNKESFYMMSAFFLFSFLCYVILILLFKYRALTQTAFSVFICFCVAAESIFFGACFIGSASSSDYNYREVVDLGEKIYDKDFYRVKQYDKCFDINMLGAIGYNNLGHYTSLTSQDYMFTMKKLGYSSYWLEVSSVGGSKFSDALFSNRYTIKRNMFFDYDNDMQVYYNNTYSIVKNPLFLPLGIKTNTDLSNKEKITQTRRPDIQETIYRDLFGHDKKLFTEYKIHSLNNATYNHSNGIYNITKSASNSIIQYKIDVAEPTTLYFDCFSELSNKLQEPINYSFAISVNDATIEQKYPKQRQNGLLNLGTFENQSVTINITVLKNVQCKSFGVYGINDNQLNNVINNTNNAVNLSVVGNKVVGTCTAHQGEFLHIAMPYFKGYSAKINGRQTDVYKVHDDFIAIRLQSGTNNIELSYIPQGFIPGLIITLIGIATSIAYIMLRKKLEYKDFPIIENGMFIIFSILFASVILAIYVLPPIIYIL